MKNKIIIKSPKEMRVFAVKFAKTLKGGEVLALTGELGSGKTAFVKGLAKALGIKHVVQSPTFLLMKCYPVKIVHRSSFIVHSLCHLDAYRIKNERELINIGLGEILEDRSVVTTIEWADLVKKIIPKRAVWMNFSHGKNSSERIVTY
jgi:tRNA threonylcarbamoyladenosine biosynthesis protein TsaE